MAGHKPWRILVDQMSPERRASFEVAAREKHMGMYEDAIRYRGQNPDGNRKHLKSFAEANYENEKDRNAFMMEVFRQNADASKLQKDVDRNWPED